MPLSEHEQRLLEQIEQSLYAEDPKFARTWRARNLRNLKRTRLIRAIIAFVVGLGALLAGVITLTGNSTLGVALGAAGFLIMLGAAWYAFATRNRVRAGAATTARRPKRSVLARLEERWQRRQDERGFGN